MSLNGKEVSFTSSDASNEVRIKLCLAHSMVFSVVFKSYFIFRKSLLQKCPTRVTDLGLCLPVQQIRVVLVRIFYGLILFYHLLIEIRWISSVLHTFCHKTVKF